jgi:hypothetical protein
VTFKELRKIIVEKRKEIERESKTYNSDHYWRGKKIISLNEWRKIANSGKALAYGIRYQNTQEAIRYFPNDYSQVLFPFGVQEGLEEEVDEWYSDYLGLMEYSRNPRFGKTKCDRCLLSPDREEAGIFIGINNIISRALDIDGVSVYPCKVLNRFACPYDSKITRDMVNDYSTGKPEVDYLFYLSELAFAMELALAKAQEEDSVFRIRTAADAYHVLTDRETLEKVLQQGLKEEHMQ